MKKRAAQVLLPLLFSCCFVCFGSLSVNAAEYEAVNFVWLHNGARDNWGISQNGIAEVYINPARDVLVQIVEQDNSTMYLSLYTSVNAMRNTTIDVYDMDGELVEQIPCSDWYTINAEDSDSLEGGNILVDFIDFQLTGNTFVLNTEAANTNRAIMILSKQKIEGSSDAYNRIVTAISKQTQTLVGEMGENTDRITESIEDQYSGDPEEEFSVDDIITQHTEKMGVLSFGSDVMLQFLDMFQSANVGTAELTLPGFNITVENVEYSVWPDYSFNFEQLNEWVPSLMSVIRVMLPAFVWLMVLRYCIKVFEDNFLAK